jgi:hypothetical protein
MPQVLSIVRASEFLRSGPSGVIDFEESKRTLTTLAAALVRGGIDKAILDLRRVRMNPPVKYTELYHLARAFQDAGFGPRHRLAVLHTLDRADKAEFFAICASGRGWNVFAFDNFEEAFEWLSVSEEVKDDDATPQQ